MYCQSRNTQNQSIAIISYDPELGAIRCLILLMCDVCRMIRWCKPTLQVIFC